MRKIVIPALAAALTVGVMIFQGRTVNPVLTEAPDITLGPIAGYTAQPYEPSEAELTVLPADTRFVKCVYTAPNGHWYQVSVVIGGKSKSSIHRPELCLPSQGNQMLDPHTLAVGDRDWHRVTLAHQDRPPVGFAYTFFNQVGYATSSHVRRIFRDVWDRSILGRIDRWVMVTVCSSRSDDRGMAAFLERLEEVLR